MKLLWVGDAAVHTGFARVTHSVVGRLSRLGYDVSVLGLNFGGDPHTYSFPIYPARLGGDPLGIGRIESLCEKIAPDVVVINNDPWNVAGFLKKKIPCPVVPYMPIDAVNHNTDNLKLIGAKAVRVVAYTEFGKKELEKGGVNCPIDIIPHGVSDIFFRADKIRSHEIVFGHGDLSGYFIVGNVNRNQPRKRLDLTLEFFSEWVRNYSVPKTVMLLIHCLLDDPHGFNIIRLAKYFDIEDRILVTPANWPESKLRAVYNSLNIQVSTSTGEGWGLTTMEGMACGVPQLVPYSSALAEWAEGAVCYAECKTHQVNQEGTLGSVVDKQDFIQKLNELYQSQRMRTFYSQAGLVRVREPHFDWDNIAMRFQEVLESVVGAEQVAVTG